MTSRKYEDDGFEPNKKFKQESTNYNNLQSVKDSLSVKCNEILLCEPKIELNSEECFYSNDQNVSRDNLFQETEIQELKAWIIKCKIPYEQADKLLEILRQRLLPSLPKTTLEFLQNEIYIDANDHEKIVLNTLTQFKQDVTRQLNEIHQSIAHVNQRQEQVINFIVDKQVLSIEGTDLLQKYSLQLPINDLVIFKEFDNNLKTQDFLRSDVKTVLWTYVNDNNIYKTVKMITAMVKAFLSKDLASKFTAARKSRKAEDTEKFKDTELWNCMKAVAFEARKNHHFEVSDQELLSKLSDCLTNVRSW